MVKHVNSANFCLSPLSFERIFARVDPIVYFKIFLDVLLNQITITSSLPFSFFPFPPSLLSFVCIKQTLRGDLIVGKKLLFNRKMLKNNISLMPLFLYFNLNIFSHFSYILLSLKSSSLFSYISLIS